MSNIEQIFQAVASISALAAAVCAAVSAYASWRTAKEARASRKADLAPRLVLEKNFIDLHFQWPHPASVNGGPVFLARKHSKDRDPSPPTFTLSNYGGGPALEIEIVFKLKDKNGSLDLSEQFKKLGLHTYSESEPHGEKHHNMLEFRNPDGKATIRPLYKKGTIDVPNCAPGQSREIEFSKRILPRVMLRGLHCWERGRHSESIEPLELSVKLRCHTVDGDLYETAFRYELFPFFEGSTNPLEIYSHIRELPMYPRGEGARVD